MGRYYRTQTTTETLAVGIKGDRSSLCGAIKRFRRNGMQWNGLLTLKEQCARHVALIKNEQLKCFITGYLPQHLFKYVTKDIFNLQRDEFTSKYADELNLCYVCSLHPDGKTRKKTCGCPKIEVTIRKLNNYFLKRMNNEPSIKPDQLKKFDLVYTMLNDQEDDYDEDEDTNSYFLFLTPCEYYNEVNMDDMDEEPFENYRFINEQVSVEDKLLFVDVMRFFGGFQTDQEQPRLVLYRRREFPL